MATHAPWPILALVGLAAPACFTDTMNTSAGPDDASSSTAASPAATDTQPASDASTSTTTPVDPTTSPTATASTADETTTPDATTTSVGTTSTSTTTTDDTTTTETPGCADIGLSVLVTAENAILTNPMQTDQDDDEGTIAFSLVEGEGTADFSFDIQCAGTYYIWARVLDRTPGTGNGQDPDSFTATINGSFKIEWLYGCTSETAWSWQRIQAFDNIACGTPSEWSFGLSTGVHTVTLGNLEAGALDKFAAVARVLMTRDPNYVPTNE